MASNRQRFFSKGQKLSVLCYLLLTSVTIFAFTTSNSSYGNIYRPTLQAVRRSSSLPLHMTILTANGKKIDFSEGSSLKAACIKLGVKPKYSCQKGDCGSCTISVGGTRIKACVGKVPPMPRLKSLQEKGLEVK